MLAQPLPAHPFDLVRLLPNGTQEVERFGVMSASLPYSAWAVLTFVVSPSLCSPYRPLSEHLNVHPLSGCRIALPQVSAPLSPRLQSLALATSLHLYLLL